MTDVAPDGIPVRKPIGSFSAFGRDWTVLRRPPTLLLSELSRADSGEFSSAGAYAELFERVLGPSEYRAFRTLAYDAEPEDDSDPLTDASIELLKVLFPQSPTA